MDERVVRLQVARLSGCAERWVGGYGEGAATAAAVNAALDSGDDPTGVLARAVAELHSFSRDPAVLARAAAPYVDDPEPHRAKVAQLLHVAGADLDAARTYRAEHPPGGFNPPQADPDRNRHT